MTKFIAPDAEFAGAPLLRGETILHAGHGEVVAATLAVTALGICEPWVSGVPASDELLTPGWSSYEWRLRVREWDVTALIKGNEHATIVIGLGLGKGWYGGRLGWDGDAAVYGEELAGYAELRVRFDDGHEQVFGTDTTWQSGPSATTANDLYDGQTIDARQRSDEWLMPGFVHEAWRGVHEIEIDPTRLVPAIAPPVRRIEQLRPQKIWSSPSGRILVDFGQNLVGFTRVQVTGSAGEALTLRHAEVLEDGELGVRPLRSAKATDTFILSGNKDVFEPTLTFHGFRYVEIEGWPAEPAELADAITAVVISSDLRRIGWFETSDERLNRLHENARWSMVGNFIDVPTDCPQRDERLGWTGDLSAFVPTATFLYDVSGFLRDWLRDLAVEQAHNGGIVPIVVPDVVKYFTLPPGMPKPGATAIWGDAAVWVPWALWEAYGDKTVLADQFESMAAHARIIAAALSPRGVWDNGFQFGDWLDPEAPADEPFRSKADHHVVATLCGYRTARILATSASILGREAGEFAALAEQLRRGFETEYLSEGVIKSDCTTVYALAIVFGILSEADREFAGLRLSELVARSGYRVSTGFAGTPFITDALTQTGHLDDAYRLLTQTECPSWLYPVSMGATTIWERWDSMLPDGSINAGEMTSFNHYAFGAIADWMHRTVGGLAPLEPGYGRTLIAPRPGGGLTWANVSHETPFGVASVRWKLNDAVMTVDATIPEGTTAILRRPGTPDVEVPAGAHRWTWTAA